MEGLTCRTSTSSKTLIDILYVFCHFDDMRYVQEVTEHFNKPPVINENQITAIRSLFHSGMSEQQFLQQWNIPAMQDIQQASYDQVSAWLIESKKISITTVTE